MGDVLRQWTLVPDLISDLTNETLERLPGVEAQLLDYANPRVSELIPQFQPLVDFEVLEFGRTQEHGQGDGILYC